MTNNMVTIAVKMKSPYDKNTRIRDIKMRQEDWDTWNSPNPPLIQNCFPYLSTDDREFILTGITVEEWDSMFPEEGPLEDWGMGKEKEPF